MARKGHTGALLALRRGGAVGQRVRVLWHVDDRFYRGMVCRFDSEGFTHSVEYDDGELAGGLRLWNESVQIVDPDMEPCRRGGAGSPVYGGGGSGHGSDRHGGGGHKGPGGKDGCGGGRA